MTSPAQTVVLRHAGAEDADAIAHLHAESWRRTYRGMMSDDFLDHRALDNRRLTWRERLDAPPPKERQEAAQAALQRAREVGEEYETVEVETDLVRARSVGAGIVDEARRRNVEVIVMGGEPPSRIRGGAILGGIGGSRPPEVGEVTEYVLKKAPCRVLLTAPPSG